MGALNKTKDASQARKAGFVRTSFETTAEVLRSGKPAIFPTDTVYGVGVSVAAAISPQVLFDLKRREATRPVAWLLSDSAQLFEYGKDLPSYVESLAHRFWPGALTLIVPASKKVPLAFQSQSGSIGLRVPKHTPLRRLIQEVGAPLATTSANFSGEPAVCSYAQLDPAFAAQVEAVFSEGDARAPSSGVQGVPLASTVLDCTGKQARLLREGRVSRADLEALVDLG